jgi:SHAQKYF class myb-like DNA-binding protein
MVITSRTYTTLFATADASSTVGELVRLPLSVVPQYERRCEFTGAIVPTSNKPLFRSNLWSSDEHERFLHGLEMFPNGPWKEVAKVVGTKSARQTMTHAQKYRQKIERRMQAKPKAPKQLKLRRRAQTANTMNFVDERLFNNSKRAHDSAFVSTSPFDVSSSGFDASFLDQEFNEILACLGPVPFPDELAAPLAGDNLPRSIHTQAWSTSSVSV